MKKINAAIMWMLNFFILIVMPVLALSEVITYAPSLNISTGFIGININITVNISGVSHMQEGGGNFTGLPEAALRDIGGNGTTLWAIWSIGLNATEHEHSGIFTGRSVNLTKHRITNPVGVAYNGSHLFVADDTSNNLTVINIGTDLSEGGINLSRYGITDPQAVEVNRSHIFVSSGAVRNITIFNRSFETDLPGWSLLVPFNDNPNGLAIDGRFMWINQGSLRRIHKYLLNGSFTGVMINTSDDPTTSVAGLSANSSSLIWGHADNRNFSVYNKNPVVSAYLSTNETGTFVNYDASYDRLRFPEVPGILNKSFHFVWNNSVLCNRVIGFVVEYNTSNGTIYRSPNTTLKHLPYIHNTTSGADTNLQMTCQSSTNVTITVNKTINIGLTVNISGIFLGTNQTCPYGANNVTHLINQNKSSGCTVLIYNASMGLFTNVTIAESAAISGRGIGNIPVAVGAGAIATLTIIYAITRKRRTE